MAVSRNQASWVASPVSSSSRHRTVAVLAVGLTFEADVMERRWVGAEANRVQRGRCCDQQSGGPQA